MRKGIKGHAITRVFDGPTEEDYKEMNKKLGLNNVKIEQPLTLRISEWCHAHIRSLHIKYPHKEWLAICKTEQVEPGVFEIVDMIHPEQTASSGSVTATDKGMDWSVDYLIEKQEDLSKWNLILHSHHSMGVFWSGTDDNARLGYNDGRFMCWAVVTAYAGDAKTGPISYKGCVNFYKPYNIEIDCEVIQPDRDLRVELEDYLNVDEKYKEKLKETKDRILEELIESSIEKINELSDTADYSRIINYLGIDITQELIENYKEVSKKMPNPQVTEFLQELERQAEEKAEEEAQVEEKEIPQELEQFREWSGELEHQIEEAFKTGEQGTKVKSWKDWYPSYTRESLFSPTIEEKTNEALPFVDEEERDATTIYTTKWFPTKESLKNEIYITDKDTLTVDKEGRRLIYCKETQAFEMIEDWLDIQEGFNGYLLDK